MYHRIADESFDPWGLAVSPERFSSQLAWLSEKRSVLTLREFAERHRRKTLPANAIAITMDDGYSCAAEVAAPLFEHFKLPATVFLPVELIEQGRPFWWDELETIVFNGVAKSLSVEGEEKWLGEMQPEDRSWNFGAPPCTTRQILFNQLYAKLRVQTDTERAHSLKELRGTGRPLGSPSKRLMSREQVRQVAGSCVEFGSHALTHPWLTELRPEDQAKEIGESMERCAALTGSRPTAFAYPFGDFDSRSEALVQEAAFTCACTVEHAAVGAASRTFALPRLQVGNWNPAQLEWALATL